MLLRRKGGAGSPHPVVPDPVLMEMRRALAQRIKHFAPQPGERPTAIPELSLYHRSAPTPCFRAFHEPGFSILVQGRKRILPGGTEYLWDSSSFLQTPQAERLRAFSTSWDLAQRTARDSWLKANYAKPLPMEELASTARMGVSTLHHQFRALTAMSPLHIRNNRGCKRPAAHANGRTGCHQRGV